MATKWEIKLVKPDTIFRDYVNDAWTRSMPELERWIVSEFIPALVYGGLGIVGIAQTPFYKFISSPRGLSELGIEASEPPKLLQAYLTTAFKIRIHKEHMVLEFGNYGKLKAATRHPADGTGDLHVGSWLEWVEGLEVSDRGFVERKKLEGTKASKAIRLGSPLGGLMLPRNAYGSSGLWRFPTQLQDYEISWVNQNIARIQSVLEQKMIEVFVRKLSN